MITAAGVSAGIDMALTLLARLHGPEIAMGLQLGIEYDPQPPVRYRFTVEGASRRWWRSCGRSCTRSPRAEPASSS